MILSHFSGWFIFEIQLICLTNIHGISSDALAAGAIWVQLETTTAAIQQGWICVTVKLRGANISTFFFHICPRDLSNFEGIFFIRTY